MINIRPQTQNEVGAFVLCGCLNLHLDSKPGQAQMVRLWGNFSMGVGAFRSPLPQQ